MAGRPRSQARKVARLEKKQEELLKAFVYEHLPALYKDRITSRSSRRNYPICAAWAKAWTGLSMAADGLKSLREVLDERAESLERPANCPLVETG